METDRNPYSKLGDLQKDLTDQAIIVRLIRKWEACNRRRGSKLLSLDLLLMDETGFVIKASINHRLTGYYNNSFKEGSIYYIRNFALDENNGRLKLSDHKFSIQFTHLTIASEVLEDAPRIGKTTFRFHNHEQLLMLANSNQQLPDVVGRITYVWGSKLRYIGSKHKIMARLVLQDKTKVRLSIWDHVASDFRKLLRDTQWNKRVVIITAVNPKIFGGDLYLNTSPATRFYVDGNLENVTKSWLQQMGGTDNAPLEHHELEEEGNGVKTISQMLSFLDVEEPQEKYFLCSARIVEIITRNGWYYISCSNCFNRIKSVDQRITCGYCHDNNFIGVARFCIEVIVDDETDQARFVIFDQEARKLTNMMAADLITFESSDCYNTKRNELPTCLEQLIGREYIFQLRATQFDFQATKKTFSVVGIVNGPI